MRVSVTRLRSWKAADRGWMRDLDCACFPTDLSYWNSRRHVWWVARVNGRAVGYAACVVRGKGRVEFTRAGVLPQFRGLGLHAALLRRRISWCRRNGHRSLYTYTSRANERSASNLRASGFAARTRGEWIMFSMELKR